MKSVWRVWRVSGSAWRLCGECAYGECVKRAWRVCVECVCGESVEKRVEKRVEKCVWQHGRSAAKPWFVFRKGPMGLVA